MTNTRMAINGQLNLQAAYTYTLNLSKVFPVERNTSLQHSAQDSTFIVPSHQSGMAINTSGKSIEVSAFKIPTE